MAIKAVREKPAAQPSKHSEKRKRDDSAKRLHATRFNGMEFATQEWRAMAPAGDTISDMLVPEYWCLVSAKMKPLCTVQVVWEDASKFAEFIVLSNGPNWAKVALLREVSLRADGADAPASPDENYEAKFVNHHFGWCVIRKSDGESIKTNLPSEDDANKFIVDFAKTHTR